MSKFDFGVPLEEESGKGFKDYALRALQQIEESGFDDDSFTISDEYTVSNFTKTRTLDASTATVSDVANVLATFLNDLKNRGTKRS